MSGCIADGKGYIFHHTVNGSKVRSLEFSASHAHIFTQTIPLIKKNVTRERGMSFRKERYAYTQ